MNQKDKDKDKDKERGKRQRMKKGIYNLNNHPITVTHWLEELNPKGIDKICLAFVGAGGKTSCMYYVAEGCAKAGKRVLVTTSTHILAPVPHVAAHNLEEVELLWKQGRYAVIGKECRDADIEKKGENAGIRAQGENSGIRTQGEAAPSLILNIDSNAQPSHEELYPAMRKWSTPDSDLFQTSYQKADIILIEADGSKGKPCKARRPYEPVIWEEVTHIISVIGMSALGQTIEKGSYPPELVAQVLNKDKAQVLSLQDLSTLTCDYWKNASLERFEPIVLINQVDDTMKHTQAMKLANMIQMSGVKMLYLSCFS